MHLFSWKQLLLRASFDSESKSKKTDPIQHPGVYELPKDQVLKNYPRKQRGFFIDVFSSKYHTVRLFLPLLVFISSAVAGQISVHPSRGLEPWFKSWYKESKKLSKKTNVAGELDKEVVALYLTVVNGKTGESEEVEGVSRAIFPSGRYSLLGNYLSYAVIPAFPTEPPADYSGVSIDWSGLYDGYIYNDSVQKRVWDPFALHPNKYRVPGLVLTQKRIQELGAFLESDTKAASAQAGYNSDRPTKGENWSLVTRWVGLIEPHWGNRWIYRSFPSVSGILIDQNKTQAVVKYGIHNGGGIARYRKEGKEWVLVESRINIMQ